jgi:PhnB protein
MAAKKKKTVRAVPRGYATVTATMNQADAKGVIAFCKKAFGAKVLLTMPAAGGKLMHAEIEIGNSRIMVSDAVMEPARVSSLFLYVENVDKTIAKAVKAGATERMPTMDMFWGDRMGSVVDPFGNIWSVATHIENVKPAEMKKRQKIALKQLAAGLPPTRD